MTLDQPPPHEAPRERFAKNPSESRDEAIASVVYRLSELMFGSLLAAYVLGFMGFTASAAGSSAVQGDLSAFWPESVTYLCISATFAYLTAGLYISYHASILTMPHLPLSRLRWDFLVALLQAVFFGLSMLSPPWFPTCVGLVLFSAVARQYREHRALVDWFRDAHFNNHRRLGKEKRRYEKRGEFKDKEDFKRVFDDTLKGVPNLSIWRPVPRSFWWALVLLVGTPILLVLRYRVQGQVDANSLVWQYTACEAAIILFLVFLFVNSMLKRRANFLYSKESMDSLDAGFESFYDKLEENVNATFK